jgi:hypothetical protein
MSADDFEKFFKEILKQDIVSEFNLYGLFEKIVSNIKVISENKFCLN